MPSADKAAEGATVSDRARHFYLILRLVLAVTVLAMVWTPHFLHYWIDRRPVPLEVLQASMRTPPTAVLKEISELSLGVHLDISDDKIGGIAEQILVGILPVPRFFEVPLTLHGYPRDYQLGPSTLQLIMASLEVENILLRAFERTRDQRYLSLAIRRTLDFATHEAAQRQGIGFLWNDHAVAARIAVLTKLWNHVRATPDFPASSAREILSLIERSGRLLAKSSHFTVRTNHGVVQNLALLQIAAAFPALPESVEWRNLGFERLSVQLPFYVSSEGFVLEHSAEYHLFGTELLVMAVRLGFLNGVALAPSLIDAATKTDLVLSRLMRPDGTLPVLGNTSAGQGRPIPVADANGTAPIRHLLPPYPRPVLGSSLFPVAGYAIWWQQDHLKQLSQTLIAWAKHDGHGHKHADEGSILLWSGGIDWVTNTGYWPYDFPSGDAAYSWTGSNAPHQVGEKVNVPRAVQLLGTGEASGVRFIDIERKNQDGSQFRRQVLQLDAQTHVVLDFSKNVSNGTETIWTIDPALHLLRGASDDTFTSGPAPDGRHLAISYAAATTAKLQVYRGSKQPFAGWVVVNNKPTPAYSLRMVDPASQSASAILFSVDDNPTASVQRIVMNPGATAEKWEVSFGAQGATTRLSRRGGSITLGNVTESNGLVSSFALSVLPAPDVAAERAELKKAYARAVDIYPPWRELTIYRLRLTYAIGVLALLVEAGWFALSRWTQAAAQRNVLYVHVGMTACWAAIAVWISRVYLA